MTRLPALLLAALAAHPAWAASASSEFAVRLTVSGGTCTSETLNEPPAAVVQVVCGGAGPFVNIEPAQGGPFTGFVGQAFRYPVADPPALEGFVPVATASGTTAYAPVGTVTEFRLVGDAVRDNRFELLISF